MQLYVNNRLDAINYVIGCLGLAPVDSEDEFNLDVAQAISCIENQSRNIQNNKGNGMWFNRETNWKFAPDPVNGTVTIPNNALSCFVFNRYKQPIKIATRGRALYDTKEHGFDMRKVADSDGFVHLMLVTQLEFDDLPQTAKQAVATAAGVQFAIQNEMEVNRIKALQAIADDAKWGLESEDTTQTKTNAFKDNRSMQEFMVYAGGINNG